MRLSLTIIMLLMPSLLSSEEVDKKLHEECLYPAIAIISGNQFGTGTIVRSDAVADGYENVFVTCDHVLSDNPISLIYVSKYEKWSEHQGYNLYLGFIVFTDKKNDFAVGLFRSKTAVYAASIETEKSFIGNKIIKVGCGTKETPRIDYGIVTSSNIYVEDIVHDGYRYSGCTIPGDSGGPIYNKERKLIALTKAVKSIGDQQVHSIGYGVPLHLMKDDKNIKYVFDKKEKIPRIPFILLNTSDFKTEKNK